MKRSRGGFTLIEMVAAVAASAFVFAAGTILVVSSMRMQKQILSDASRVSDARVVLTMIENLASDGAIAPPVHNGDNVEIKNTSTPSTTVLKYDVIKKTIYAGENNDTPLMEDVKNFTATVDGLLLKVKITDSNDEEFSTSVYCRSWAPELSEIKENLGSTPQGNKRYELISIAFGQLGSKGEIIGNTGATPQTYAEWFDSAWTSGTYPVIGWCGCFVSWCIGQSTTQPSNFTKFAYVHEGVKEFRNRSDYILPTDDESKIIPGDVIFFDKDNKTTVTDDWFDTGNSNPLTPDHTGIVLKVDDGMVYTIEGNRHKQVAFGTYELTDPIIIGYGRLDWSA